ncbi:MAG: polymer-forming cytoskeletal protein [Anaerolineales bacterium]|nr:polymer-forming cytoskeletal protein [Anaerolineales bacterium]
MKMKFRLTALLLLFALLFLPTGSAFAQGPGPGSGRVVFGSNITIESGETFDGDLVLFGGNVAVEEGAELNGDLVVIGGNIVSDGSLNGDVVVVGGQIKLEETAVVSGDVVLIGGQMQRAEGAEIGGDVVNNVAPQIDIPDGKVPPVVPEVPSAPPIPDVPGVVNVNFNPLFEFGRVFAASLLMAVLGALAVLFFQERLDKVSRAVVVQPLMTTSIGLLTVVALLVVAVTIILLPVALLSLIPLGFAWLFGVIAIGREIGERFARAIRQNWTPVLTTGLGTFILMFVVGFIQALNDLSWVVGCFTWIVPAFVGLLAIGAVVITRFGAKPIQSPAMSVSGPLVEPDRVPPASGT